MSLRTINFLLMVLLIILEATSTVVNILIVKNCLELESDPENFREETIIGSVLSMIQEFFSVVYIIIFGIHSLYFKICARLRWYILFSIFMIVFYSGITITTYVYELSHQPKDTDLIQQIKSDKFIVIAICLVKTIAYFISIILTHKERQRIIQEINESPYNMVDEDFTEQMYKNIMSHSLNPMNKDAKEEFTRYTIQSKEKGKQRSMKSIPFSVNSSRDEAEQDKDNKNPLVTKDKQ